MNGLPKYDNQEAQSDPENEDVPEEEAPAMEEKEQEEEEDNILHIEPLDDFGLD